MVELACLAMPNKGSLKQLDLTNDSCVLGHRMSLNMHPAMQKSKKCLAQAAVKGRFNPSFSFQLV